MKKIIFIPFYFYFLVCYSQCSLKFLDIKQDAVKRIISIDAFAQNLGGCNNLRVCYGQYNDCRGLYYNNAKESYVDFFMQYELPDITGNTVVKLQPNSITIKTILGTFVPMEQPTYYFPLTGSISGQNWNFVFPYPPNEAGNVIISLLGITHIVGDMPHYAQVKDKIILEQKRIEEEKQKIHLTIDTLGIFYYYDELIDNKSLCGGDMGQLCGGAKMSFILFVSDTSKILTLMVKGKPSTVFNVQSIENKIYTEKESNEKSNNKSTSYMEIHCHLDNEKFDNVLKFTADKKFASMTDGGVKRIFYKEFPKKK